MKRQHTYEQIIGQKLNRLTPPDTAGLWDSMEAILDREMPQQEKKSRRTGAWWLNANLLVAASLFFAVGSVYTLCRVAGKEPVRMIDTAASDIAGGKKTDGVVQKAKPSSAITATGSSGIEKNIKGSVVDNGEAVSNMTKNRVDVAADATIATEKAQETASIREEDVQSSAEGNIALVVTADNSQAPAEEMFADKQVETNDVYGVASPVKEVAPVKASVPAIFDQQVLNTAVANIASPKQKKTRVYSDKGIVAGTSLTVPVALNQQQKNALDMKGQKNQWQDLMPAVYAQWHLSKMFYVQAEWQPVTAQYTPNFTLYNRTDILNPDEKEQKIVKLNKLYYTSLPLSFHYNTPLKNVTVGVGVQYTKLKKVILQDQEHYHLIQAGGVFKVEERKNEVAVKDPEEVRSHSTGDVVDSVASSIRREDWRLLADVGYRYKGFNFGVRYTHGLRNYVNSNFTNLPVKDRNEALQVYLRFNLFDGRKK